MCRWVAKGTRRCPSQERPRRQMCVPKSPHTHKKCVTRFKWLTMSGVHSCAGILSLVFKHGAWKQMTFLRLHNNVVNVEAFLTLGCFSQASVLATPPKPQVLATDSQHASSDDSLPPKTPSPRSFARKNSAPSPITPAASRELSRSFHAVVGLPFQLLDLRL